MPIMYACISMIKLSLARGRAAPRVCCWPATAREVDLRRENVFITDRVERSGVRGESRLNDNHHGGGQGHVLWGTPGNSILPGNATETNVVTREQMETALATQLMHSFRRAKIVTLWLEHTSEFGFC